MKQPEIVVTEKDEMSQAEAERFARLIVREVIRLVRSGEVALPPQREVG